MIWLKNYQYNIYTTSSLAATSLCFKLLTFPCREMIKLAIHIQGFIWSAALRQCRADL